MRWRKWLVAVPFITLLSVGLPALDRTRGPAQLHLASWSVLGLALCVCAIPIGIMAWRTLGHAYASDPTILPGQKLITWGIYGIIRHPMHTAALLWALGLPLVARSLWGMVTAVALIGPALWLRTREEEAMLLEAFGEKYRTYMRRTRRMIPFIF